MALHESSSSRGEIITELIYHDIKVMSISIYCLITLWRRHPIKSYYASEFSHSADPRLHPVQKIIGGEKKGESMKIISLTASKTVRQSAENSNKFVVNVYTTAVLLYLPLNLFKCL